ncbi:Fc.00g045040.m01.CDS01 [Cosmosporella sp. VM-42]
MSDLNTVSMVGSSNPGEPEQNSIRALGQAASHRWITDQNLCMNCRDSQDAVWRYEDYMCDITIRDLKESDCEFCDVLYRAFHQCASQDELEDEDREIAITISQAVVEIQVGFDLDEVKHLLCNNSDAAFSPTRLIDLGSCNDEIRLVETNTETRGLYVCLSHCWGKKKPLVTTKSDLKRYLESIPWHAIPQTFRDAICYARVLRIRYIWIDSLCIIQDDPDDWAIESKAMGQIYNHAYLTLGAVTAPDSSAGMFGGPSTSPLKAAAQIAGITITGLPYMYNVFKLSNRSGLHPESWRTYNDRQKWPLLGRAWVLQERMITPRFLHIGYPELRWECREAILCQCGDPYNTPRSRKARYTAVLDYGGVIRPEGVFKRQQQRRELIESYSMLALTCYEDKLPAFSGLAKQVCRPSPTSDYLAGLFRDSLVVDMLWHAETLDPNSTTNLDPKHNLSSTINPLQSSLAMKSWRAPTWSWASVDAHIVFPLSSYYTSDSDEPDRGTLLESYIEILDARCTTATSDPTGQIRDGFIILSGPAFDCSIKRGDLFITVSDGDSAVEGKLYLDRPSTRPDQQLSCLCIRSANFRRVRTSMVKNDDVEYSLVLECLSAPEKRYRRLGVFIQSRGSQFENGPWELHSSSFASGGRLEAVTII